MQHQPIPKLQIILTAIVIIGMVGWFVAERTDNVPVVMTPSTTDDEVVAWPSREVTKEFVSESNQYYAIEAAYPVTADPRISDSFRTFITDQIAQFKEDTSWATDPSIDSASAGSLSLNIDYKTQQSTTANTYTFDIATYTGGAHGLLVTRTFNFDKNGKVINLADLFTNGEAGLKTIAPFVQKEIEKKKINDDAQWVKEGTAPTAENYQAFTVSDAGITFTFDAYQVAPYSAGTQNILVPLSVFKSIANPDLF